MSAVISPCETYRYSLGRDWGLFSGRAWGPLICWIMVNPSTADANDDDATIRKVRGFTERMGAHRFVVGNLFAYRSTDIKELKKACDPIGPDNHIHLADMIERADRVIFAWGASGKMPPQFHDQYLLVSTLVSGQPEKGPFAIGICKDGSPRHPLMTPYSEPMVRFDSFMKANTHA